MAPERGIDILFATHNGARTLPRMLAALRQLEPPQRPWRVIAVDNASTDATPELLRDAAADLAITVLHCPVPGKEQALKVGAAAVQGDLVLLTDDDVEPVPGWLKIYEEAADSMEEIGLFGGPIVPTPIEGVLPWFEASRDHHAELFASSDHPDGPVNAVASIYGPNYLIRRAYLDVFDYHSGLGPTFAEGKSRTYPMGEDTMVMELLTRRGAAARYVRGAAVKHLVRTFQTDLDFMLRRAQRHGRGAAIRLAQRGQRPLMRRFKLLASQLPRIFHRPGLAAQPPSPERFNALWDAHWSRGACIGAAFGPYPDRD